MASMFLLPLFMQELLGFTAMQSGLALMPRALVMMVGDAHRRPLYNRVSPRLLVAFGILLLRRRRLAAEPLHPARPPGGRSSRAILVQGVGFACLFVPLTTAALSNVPRDAAHRRHRAQLAAAPDRRLDRPGHLRHAALALRDAGAPRLVAHLSPDRPEVLERLSQPGPSRGARTPRAAQAALQALASVATRQAMVLAFEQVFLLTGLVFLAVLPLLLFLKVNRAGPTQRSPATVTVHGQPPPRSET